MAHSKSFGIKIFLFKYRIFILAFLISILWHIFWLSAVTITTPNLSGPVKFSKVSFLGPLLEMGSLELRVEPAERSFLEKRCLATVQGLSYEPTSKVGELSTTKHGLENGSYRPIDKSLKHLINEAVSGSKLEPLYHTD